MGPYFYKAKLTGAKLAGANLRASLIKANLSGADLSAAIAQICWERFEPTIRQRPEQWLWPYKHWRYRPVEDAGCYPFYANCSQKFEREIEQVGMP